MLIIVEDYNGFLGKIEWDIEGDSVVSLFIGVDVFVNEVLFRVELGLGVGKGRDGWWLGRVLEGEVRELWVFKNILKVKFKVMCVML